MLLSWFRSKVSSPRRAAKTRAAKTAPKGRYPKKCVLELLEDRTLPSQLFTVNLVGDAGLGDNGTNSAGQTAGDIRYCITQAEQQVNVGSTIQFASTVFGTNKALTLITLNTTGSGELQISQTTTITGPGFSKLTISGNNITRIFDVTSQSATVIISGLTITHGDAAPAANSGGNQGGDVFNSGTLTLLNDVVSNGVAEGLPADPVGRGGGIFNAGGSGVTGATLTLDGTTVTGNVAHGLDDSGTVAVAEGGGVYNDLGATLTLVDGSTLTNNTAQGGAGVDFTGQTAASAASLGEDFTGQTAPAGFNGNPGGAGTPGANAGDAGDALGGGIYNVGTLAVNGSAAQQITFSGNLAQGGTGGTGENGGAGGGGENGGNSPGGPTSPGGGSGGNAGPGGSGGNGANGGNAEGGSIYNSGTVTAITDAQFQNETARGGAGGAGGFAGLGGVGGNAGNLGGAAGNGASAGQGGIGGVAGFAQGGSIFNGFVNAFTVGIANFAGTNTGTILGSSNNGLSWGVQPSGTANELDGVWGNAPNDVFAVGYNGTILHSTNFGVTWTAQNSTTGQDLNHAWGSSSTDMFVVGANGVILHSTNDGGTWTAQNSNTTNGLFGVWGTSATDEFAVGLGGTIDQSTNDGTTWTVSTPTAVDLYGVWGNAANDVFAVGLNATILHYNGTAWSVVHTGTANQELLSVWGSGPDDMFAVGYDTSVPGALILHSTNDGATWTPQTSGVNQILDGVYGVGSNEIFIVGSNGTILYSNNDGATWTPEVSATPVVGSTLLLNSVWVSGATAGFGSVGSITGTTFTNDMAIGGAGGAGGHGGSAGGGGGAGGNGPNLLPGNAGGTGGNGGQGGNAGAGGLAQGGAIYNGSTGSVGVISQTSAFTGDQAIGGLGGTGGAGLGQAGAGGNGGNGGGGSSTVAPIGGAGGLPGLGEVGGNGAAGGIAEGGGLYSTGALSAITQTTFSTDKAVGGNAGTPGNNGNGNQGSAGGNGGNGGAGGASGGAGPGAGGIPSPGQRGGDGGTTAIGGLAEGGGLYSSQGALSLATVQFLTDTVSSGSGGGGGQGGAGGIGGIGGTGGVGSGGGVGATGGAGGAGANGQVGFTSGVAEGGGVFDSGGDVTLSGGVFTGDQATSAVAGTGGNGGHGGAGNTGGRGGAGNSNFNGGNGGAGGNGASGGLVGDGATASVAQGGGLALLTGNLTISSSSFGGSTAGQGNVVTGGAGGAGAVGGAGGGAGAGGAGGPGGSNAGPGAPGLPGNGGAGGAGGNAGDGAVVYGGAIADDNTGDNVTVTGTAPSPVAFTDNAITSGAGGAGGNGGGGDGGTAYGGAFSYYVPAGGSATTNTVSFTFASFGGNGVTGGAGGAPGGSAEDAKGGGVGVVNLQGATTVTVSSSTFTANTVTAGAGATGGGNGAWAFGAGIDVSATTAESTTLTTDQFAGNVSAGGAGGADGGDGGSVHGGSVEIASAASVTAALSSSPVSTSTATAGAGGLGGGNGGNGGSIQGGGVDIAPNTSVNASLTNSPVTATVATAGVGGAGVGGGGGGDGGAIAGGGVNISALTGGTVTLNTSSVMNTTTAAGGGGAGAGGGRGGDGGAITGGGVNISSTAGETTTLTGCSVANTTATSGVGGAGGASFAGGNGGASGSIVGGGLDVSSATAGTTSLTDSPITTNTATALAGGAGGAASNGNGGSGGVGGTVEGGGLASINQSLTVTSTGVNTSPVTGDTALGGAGGAGGAGGGPGGNAGNGGVALGGGIYFSNTVGGTLTFSFVGSNGSDGSQVANNILTAGAGGVGGDSGSGGASSRVPGGAGGAGGNAEGAGIYAQANASSVNTIAIAGATLDGNTLTAGAGGQGGQGGTSTAAQNGPGSAGGAAGNALGGGLYINSLNIGTAGKLTLSGDTLAGNTVTGGTGGNAGTGNTSNGGNGGVGGVGGNATAGGLYSSDTTLTVVNTTIGGTSLSTTQPDQYSNTLTAGNGGFGGNGGTADGQLAFSDGGNGGVGGSVRGGGVYINSGTATFLNDTIVNNVANLILTALTGGAGGSPGDAAGNGSGLSGTRGVNGAANGGGYFANGGTNNVGNTIIALNAAGTNLNTSSNPPTIPYASTSPDISGAFTSEGNNLIGDVTGGTGPGTIGATGFGAGTNDQTGTLASPLNPMVGPLQNNGGPTPTDGLLSGSLAVAAGNTALVTAALFGSPAVDQRGPGWQREIGGKVDVGAIELQAPTITNLSPNTTAKGTAVTLTITGSDFIPGAVVSFAGMLLTPTSVTPTQVQVSITAADLFTAAASDSTSATQASVNVNVTVDNPDASGIAGNTINSNALSFDITPPLAATVTPVNPGAQTNTEGDVLSGATALTITSNDPDANSFTDVVGGVHTLPPGLSISAAGVITGTIGTFAEQNSVYSVTISAVDDDVTSSTTFNWTVNQETLVINSPGNLTNTEGDVVNLTITSPNADPNSFGATGLPPGLSISTAGVITGTIKPFGFGTYTTIISATHDSTSGSIQFTWTVNKAPLSITNPGSQTNTEGDPVSLTISSSNNDPNSFSATGLPAGLSISKTGVITGNIGLFAAQNSPYTTIVSATHDGVPGSVSFTWTVNQAPLSITNPGAQTNTEGDPVSLAISSSNADPNSFSATGLPAGLSISTAGVISGNVGPFAAPNSPYTVIVSATHDGTPGSIQFTWTVNQAPLSITNPGAQTNTEGDPVSLTISSSNADPNSFSATGLPTGLSISKTGVISANVGPFAAPNSPYTVIVSATHDGTPGSVSFTWTVKQAPLVINNPGNQTNTEGDVVNRTITSPNADPNSFSAKGLPPGLSISTAGVITGTINPNTAQNSPYTVKISATHDGTAGSIQFSWTVKPLPPTLTNPGPQFNNPGDMVSLTISATGADPNTFTATGLPPGLSISTAGVITGTVTLTDGGVYSVVVSASHDGAGGSTSFTWTVPTLTNPGNQVNNPLDNVSLQLSYQDFTSFSANGTLPPGLSISNTGLIFGTVADSPKTYAVVITAKDGTLSASISFNWTVNFPPSASAVVLESDGALIEFSPSATGQVLSPAGSTKAVSTVQDSTGVTAVYAITTGLAGPQYLNTLWENYNGAWSERSTGSFKQISATTNQSGAAVVFGLLTDGSLWQETAASGLNTGWIELSGSGTIQSISAVTDTSGNQWCYAIVTTSNNLWLYGPAFPTGWKELSNGSFQQVSAGLNTAGQAVSYSVLTGGQLWEQDPTFGAVGFNTGFRQLSGVGVLPATFQSAQAGGPDKVFGVAADGTIWEHSPNGNAQLSPIFKAAQLSATETPEGVDDVFATLIDGSFWEYNSFSSNAWTELLASGAASSSTPE